MKLELVATEGMAQVALERHPFHETFAQGQIERLVAAAAELPGAVHGSLGVSQQLLGGLGAQLADRYADACGEDHFLAIDFKRLGDQLRPGAGRLR